MEQWQKREKKTQDRGEPGYQEASKEASLPEERRRAFAEGAADVVVDVTGTGPVEGAVSVARAGVVSSGWSMSLECLVRGAVGAGLESVDWSMSWVVEVVEADGSTVD